MASLYQPSKIPYSISSPQHIDGESLKRIFPSNFFDYRFALARHPIKRLESAFIFNKYKLGRIDKRLCFNEFITNYLAKITIALGSFDNHFLPQVKFLDPCSKYYIFKLENNGIERAKAWVESTALQEQTNRKIDHLNKNYFGKPENTELNSASKKMVEEIYFEDFKQFHYKSSL